MHKLALTAATLGILSIGGIATASAQYYGPAAGPGTVYVEPGVTVYEGRNTYVAPGYDLYPDNTQGQRTAQDFMWKMPGDQAIINQLRANERSK